MRRLFCILITAVFILCGTWAVPAQNPFDLRFRLDEVTQESAASVAGTGNPFDLVPHRAPGATKVVVAVEERPEDLLITLPKGNTMAPVTLFVILLVTLLYFTFSVASNRGAVGKAWRGFLHENALTIAQREASGLAGNTPYYLLYGNFLLNAGIFTFLIVQSVSGSEYNNIGFFFLCQAFAWAIFLSKHLLLRIAQALFPVEQEVSRYNFLITIFNCVLGLFLVPFNFLISFLLEYKDFLVFWAVGLAIVFYGYRSLRAIGIGSKFLAGHQFHFLLYLCTVEIAPVLILVKLLQLKSG